MKLLYAMLRKDMIRRLKKEGWGTKRINSLFLALGFPPPLVKKEKKNLPKVDGGNNIIMPDSSKPYPIRQEWS